MESNESAFGFKPEIYKRLEKLSTHTHTHKHTHNLRCLFHKI